MVSKLGGVISKLGGVVSKLGGVVSKLGGVTSKSEKCHSPSVTGRCLMYDRKMSHTTVTRFTYSTLDRRKLVIRKKYLF